MASETDAQVNEALGKLQSLDEEGRDLAIQLIESLVDVRERRENGVEDGWYAEREAMEQRYGITVQQVADRLWGHRMEGRIAKYVVAALNEQSDEQATWGITYVDGRETGPLTFAQVISALDELEAQHGSIDPVLAVSLEDAVDRGWIDKYEHFNLRGEAYYALHVTRDGRQLEWAGSTTSTRAALWGMAMGALAD